MNFYVIYNITTDTVLAPYLIGGHVWRGMSLCTIHDIPTYSTEELHMVLKHQVFGRMSNYGDNEIILIPVIMNGMYRVGLDYDIMIRGIDFLDLG
tara:strand:- start:213 stop:497 length:285 start_codon:yes stop_codon:yes gene_type:complete